MQWFVKRLANKNYTIRNVDHGLYLKPQDGYWAKEGNEVVGVIGELAAVEGNANGWKILVHILLCLSLILNNGPEFSIGTIKDPDICWSLSDGEDRTPVG
jgi:hypothetical protein